MFTKYILAASLISGLFGIYETHNADVIRSKDVVNKMLISEKLSIVSFYTLTGFIKFPLIIINNLNYLEIKYRNDDFKNYDMEHLEKKPKKLYDYMP
jgi:hypothetical protein